MLTCEFTMDGSGHLGLAGQAITPLAIPEMSSLLSNSGIVSCVRQSSHYCQGKYVRVFHYPIDFTLEKIDNFEYLLRGFADNINQLSGAAHKVSEVLAASKIKHRMEIYDSKGNMADYYHHDWPSEDAG